MNRRSHGAAVHSGGLYIHIPFCASLCRYCHFPRTDRHDAGLRRRLVTGLIAEWRLRRDRCHLLADRHGEAQTCYVGGGTPSLLEPDLVARLAVELLAEVPWAGTTEFTVEANPESLDSATAAAWRAAGADRVSLGVQSLDRDVLHRLGRQATPPQSLAALELAVRTFPRVSADWILAPGCRYDRLVEEFRLARELGVGHISFYILELHPGTPLAADVSAGRVDLPPEDETERLYLLAAAALEELGYRQYEVSNFALPGQQSRHNRAYWRGVPYLGLGPGAHGFWGRRRCANLDDPAAYLAAVETGHLPERFAEVLTPCQRRLERLMLGLRTVEGIPLVWLEGADHVLAAGEGKLWCRQGDRLVPTRRGWLRLDAVQEALVRHFVPPAVR